MIPTVDSSTFQNQSWMTEYDQALAMGQSVEELIDLLNEQLQQIECQLVWNNREVDNMTVVETQAKAQLQYEMRLEYLNSKQRVK